MSNKIAYVIMPYDNRYKRFYSMIIKRAAEELGYQCIREDLTGINGHVLNNVVRNLSESDIVIADLTGLNWNVAYELGIRHAMSGKGTIMVCEEDTKNAGLPFDIQHYGIILYSENWLEEEQDDIIVNKIKQQIEASAKSGLTDSPVHEVYEDLPDRILDSVNPESDEQEARIRELEEQNRKLRERVEKAGLDRNAVTGPSDNVRALLQEAVANSIYYSDEAVRQLRKLQNDGKREEFADFLASVLDRGFLDEQDCKSVYRICRNLDVPMLTRVFLEQATQLYPDSEDLSSYLANDLCKSYKTRDKAQLIVNERIGLIRKDGRYEITKKNISSASLAAFFNVYLELKQYTDVIEIARMLLDICTKRDMQCTIRRNIITALIRLQRPEEAMKEARDLLELDSTDDINHHRAFLAYRENNRLAEAYEQLEECLHLDPDDADYPYIIAGYICDYLTARTSVTEAPTSIIRADRERYSVPFILYRVSQQPSDYKRAADFLIRNRFQDVSDRMMAALRANLTGSSFLDQFTEYDFTFVRYCLNLKDA